MSGKARCVCVLSGQPSQKWAPLSALPRGALVLAFGLTLCRRRRFFLFSVSRLYLLGDKTRKEGRGKKRILSIFFTGKWYKIHQMWPFFFSLGFPRF